MPSAGHILETALLILAAFLIGCVIGYLARRLSARKPAQMGGALTQPRATSDGPELVVAPTIVPVSRKPTPAQRLAAAAAGSAARPGSAEPGLEVAPVLVEAAPVPVEAVPVMQPARRAGLATSGKVVAAPLDQDARSLAAAAPAPLEDALSDAAGTAAPPVVPERPQETIRAEDVPQIDEAAQVVEGTNHRTTQLAGQEHDVFADAPMRELRSRPEADVPEPEPAAVASSPLPFEDDAEVAAMRAIEGGWTPRAAVAPQQPAPEPDLAPSEIEAAMRSARSAVASASAAAEAVVSQMSGPAADVSEPAPGETARAAVFEPEAPQATRSSFLDEPAPVAQEGLDFEPERPVGGFGRPKALPAPREGGKDNLRQIKGITLELEQALNRLGIFHHAQVADWDQKAVVWLDNHLGLHGRIGRERWIDQARALAGGHAGRSVKR